MKLETPRGQNSFTTTVFRARKGIYLAALDITYLYGVPILTFKSKMDTLMVAEGIYIGLGYYYLLYNFIWVLKHIFPHGDLNFTG